MGFDSRLAEGFDSLGFEGTRPVQGAVIPLALGGHDVVAAPRPAPARPRVRGADSPAAAERSAGLRRPAREPYTRALILAPTRELAMQIEDSLVGLTYHTPVTSAPVFGGVEMGPQERALQAGVDIVVATPGRLMDHMRHGDTDFVRVQMLVLDEADRMMDMGFWPDVQRSWASCRRIVRRCSSRRRCRARSQRMAKRCWRRTTCRSASRRRRADHSHRW